MNYPLISEYVEAIKSSEDNFEQLKNLRPVLGENGEPVMTSGNFAVVFKMKDEQTEKLYAVKCFTKEQEGRAEAYREITKELRNVSSPYLVSIQYLEKELFVDSDQTTETEFPVILMDWVEGKALDKYLRENLDDRYALEMLAYHFSQLAQWLLTQPFAHGDLKPDNILVRDDSSLVLVDYDGMYVPAMKGQKARELGSPDFRHPLRTENDFDEHIDDFPLAVLTFSVLAAIDSPKTFSIPLLTEKNYFNPAESLSVKQIYPSNRSSLNRIVSVIINCLVDGTMEFLLSDYNLVAKYIRFDFFIYAQNYYDLLIETHLDDNVLLEDFQSKCIYDEDDTHYPITLLERLEGHDNNLNKVGCHLYKGCLLRAHDHILYYEYDNEEYLTEMYIPSNTIVIGRNAFLGCEWVELVIIPNSVKYIGDYAFYDCQNLRYIVLPDAIEDVGKNIFNLSKNKSIKTEGNGNGTDSNFNIIVPNGTKEHYLRLLPDYHNYIIDFSEFLNKSDSTINPLVFNIAKKIKIRTEKLIRFEGQDEVVTIPYGTKILCDGAFRGQKIIKKAILPETIEVYGNNLFRDCENLEAIELPSNMKCIPDGFLYGCKKIKTVHLPNGLTHIGSHSFAYCESLEEIILPESLIYIDYCCFENCTRMKSVYLPDAMRRIGGYAFGKCKSLKLIKMPIQAEELGGRIFHDCIKLESITIPAGVKSIPYGLFDGCSSLSEVFIPNEIIHIGSLAFNGNTSLHKIQLPPNLEFIDWGAFSESGIEEIYIPNKVTHIGNSAFKKCMSLKVVHFSHNSSLTKFEKFTFDSCSSLEIITLPKSIKDMGEWTFCGCESLKDIYLPAKIKIIGNGVFYNCVNLQRINDLEEIGNNAFNGCKELTHFTIDHSVKSIGHLVFKGVNINNLKLLSSQFEKDDMAIYTKGKIKLIEVLMIRAEWEIPDSVETICEWAFYGSSFKKLVIPKSVKNIERNAFVSSPIDVIEIVSMINVESGSFCDEIGSIVVPTHLLNYSSFAC